MIGGLLLASAVFIALALPESAGSAEAVPTLHSVDFVLSDAALPPPADAPWSPQPLPDWWAQSRPGIAQTSGWYRLRFEIAQGSDVPHAIYIARSRPAADVFVNDMLIGRAALPDRPQRTVYPQYLGLPPRALHAGTNEVYVHLRGIGVHGLTPVTVGEDVAVRPLYERRYFWQVTGVQFCSLFAAVWGVFSLLLWLRLRTDRMYLYFGLSALCWVIYTSSAYLRFPPAAKPLVGRPVRPRRHRQAVHDGALCRVLCPASRDPGSNADCGRPMH